MDMKFLGHFTSNLDAESSNIPQSTQRMSSCNIYNIHKEDLSRGELMNFKEWLYRETFELPFDTIKDIYLYYLNGYKQYIKAPRKKIPPERFKLDLAGTNYDFLQYLDPTVQVELKGSIPGTSGDYVLLSPNLNHWIGSIRLSLSDFESVNRWTIEHEVLHYLQDLFQKHARRLPYRKRPADKRKYRTIEKDSSVTIGGLPNMPLVKRIMKNKGIKRLRGDKRTKHEHRPIEYYTNLNSVIRGLQHVYINAGLRRIEYGNIIGSDFGDISKWNSDSRKKRLFLELLIHAVLSIDFKEEPRWDPKLDDLDRELSRVGFDYEMERNVVSDLMKIKKLDQELYRIYMREIQKNFISNDNFTDTLKARDLILQGKQEAYVKKKQKEQKEKDKREKIEMKSAKSLGKWTEADFAGRLKIDWDLDEFSNLSDDLLASGNQAIASDMFDEIGLKSSDKDDSYTISLNPKNLFKLFDNIKQKRETYEYPGFSRELIKCNFDHMAKRLAKNISERLHEIKRQANDYDWSVKVPTKEEILEIFYPGPYASCENEEGWDNEFEKSDK